MSRQLWWGHRIPAYRLGSTSDGAVAASSQGGDGDGEWVVAKSAESAAQLLREQRAAVCEIDGEGDEVDELGVVQDEDVLDTWFSSALLPLSALGWPSAEKNEEDASPSASQNDSGGSRVEVCDLSSLRVFHMFQMILRWFLIHLPSLCLTVTYSIQGTFTSPYYPLSLMETGSDILFFWVARMSMLCSELAPPPNKHATPFKNVWLHPMVYISVCSSDPYTVYCSPVLYVILLSSLAYPHMSTYIFMPSPLPFRFATARVAKCPKVWAT